MVATLSSVGAVAGHEHYDMMIVHARLPHTPPPPNYANVAVIFERCIHGRVCPFAACMCSSYFRASSDMSAPQTGRQAASLLLLLPALTLSYRFNPGMILFTFCTALSRIFGFLQKYIVRCLRLEAAVSVSETGTCVHGSSHKLHTRRQ